MKLSFCFFLLIVIAQVAQAGTLIGFGSGFKDGTFLNAFHSWTYDTVTDDVQLFENDDSSLEPTNKSILTAGACSARTLYVLINDKLIGISQSLGVVSTSTTVNLGSITPGYMQHDDENVNLLLVGLDSDDQKVKLFVVNPTTGDLTQRFVLDGVDSIDTYAPSAIHSDQGLFFWIDTNNWKLVQLDVDTGDVTSTAITNLPANTSAVRVIERVFGSLRCVFVTGLLNVNTYVEMSWETALVSDSQEFPAGSAVQTAFLRPGGYDKDNGIMYFTSSVIGGWYELDLDPLEVVDWQPNTINSGTGAPNTYGVVYLEDTCEPPELPSSQFLETTVLETTLLETVEIEIPDSLISDCVEGYIGENCDIAIVLLGELLEIWNPTDDLTESSVEVNSFNFDGESVELDLSFDFSEDVFDALNDIFFVFSGVNWETNENLINPFETIDDEFDVLNIGFQIEFLDDRNTLVQPADGSAVFVEICPGLSDDELLASALLFFDTALDQWLTTTSACADGIESSVDLDNGCVSFPICHTTQYQMVVGQIQESSTTSSTFSTFSTASSSTTTSSATMISSPHVWLSLACVLLAFFF